MTATAVKNLLNSAMDRLGQRSVVFTAAGHLSTPINDLERICARNFDDCVKAVIAIHPWNCVTLREDLVISETDPPGFEFSNRFPFPTSKHICRLNSVWLGDVQIKTDEFVSYYGDFRVEGQSIITDSDEVSIEFTYFPVQANGETSVAYDTRMGVYFGLFDDLLRQLIIKKIAFELSYAFVNNATLKQNLAVEYEDALRRAIGRNTRENPRPRFANRDLIDIRWTY